jgi:class 3 adenylate cyclase
VDPSGDSGGGLTATGLSCGSCGTELPPNSKFCNECGAPLTQATRSAEYKQVTVLFADVVHSMDIAVAVGAERLREIMADLADRCAAVVQRYGGTVDKFTGDGIMAVFGAPAGLEDHAVRACMAALGVQEEAKLLAAEVQAHDAVDLQLRVGLNSGQVIAGEIGSGSFGYTTVGEQVGMAQRMESGAPPGGVMLSESTARLVDGAAALGEREFVRIKGADEPVAARRLLRMEERHHPIDRAESNLVGRRWELSAVEALLDRAVEGHGAVVALVGLSGIGKSRVVGEIAAIAAARGVDVFTAYCESHATDIPFHIVARLLRAATGVSDLDGPAARDRVRDRIPDADPDDLLLFDDLLGIADPNAPLPAIDPDARRRRLTALVNGASLARESPAVYVVEDAHWIDEVSESMVAEFLTVIPQTPSLVLVSYRPEYEGALARVRGAQTVALAPLGDSETAALVADLLGPNPSVGGLAATIAERAAGNPFFAEEIVRDLAERGVLQGQSGAYLSTAEGAEVSVPATLQATIAARVDRLDAKAKRTLSAAAVIGSRFRLDLITELDVEPVADDLVAAELIDQVRFTRQPEYVFHHPLIRAVAYESQLKSDRAELHRRLAAAIESRDPASADENAALIAEHLEAAGDLHAAFGWHMRAATWSANRDIIAARISWQRARQIADALPADDTNRITMRIAPRTMLCATAWRVQADSSSLFDELRELCTVAGDKASLAIGMMGLVMEGFNLGRVREASQRASEHMSLVESIGDATLTIALSLGAIAVKLLSAEIDDALRWSQTVVDLAEGDPTKGNLVIGSPLAAALVFRGVARWWLGSPGWREDLVCSEELVRRTDPVTHAGVVGWRYGIAISNGILLADDSALRAIGDALQIAEESSDDLALGMAKYVLFIALMNRGAASDRKRGLEVLTQFRDMCLDERFALSELAVADFWTAYERDMRGEHDGAVPIMRQATDEMYNRGQLLYYVPAAGILVERLLAHGTQSDVAAAESEADRLASVETHRGGVVRDIWLLRLRALLAKAHGDEASYCDYRDRYRGMARSLGYEGHIAWAEAMP